MKKTLIVTSALLVGLSFPVVILAQGQGAKTTVAPQSNQVQNQNQVQTTNQGEDQQLEVSNQEQESAGLGEGQATTAASPKSEVARQSMSVVAETVEGLLTTQGARGGIGQQISEVAVQQQQAQQGIEAQLVKLEARKGLIKTLFGPDYKAIKNLNQQVERNQLRIQQLQQLQTQVVNQADQTQVQEAVQALVEQNTALQDQVQSEESTPSLFGWLFRLFAGREV